ncbi:MAG: hypothetical protein AAFZ63_07210 [Bacteroidota bacterium]
MLFTHTPLLDRMEEFYLLPRNRQRFETYLEMMLGADRADIVLPIASFNPMGKELVLSKIQELKQVDAEGIVQTTVERVNVKLEQVAGTGVSVALNLVDDVGGAWSNRYTTDYTSKFDFGGTFKRHFCLPYFWTSETYTEELVRHRCLEYIYRFVHWQEADKPETLGDHLQQEVSVQTQLQQHGLYSENPINPIMDQLAKTEAENDNYNFIFNFFYGDAACEVLNYPTHGVAEEEAGFQYAAALATQSSR